MSVIPGGLDGALAIGAVIAAVILAMGMRLVGSRQERHRRDPRRGSTV